MSNSLDKIVDMLSKLISLQQASNIQKDPVSSEAQNTMGNVQSTKDNQNEKYIYISKEDLVSMFPNLEGKLDLKKILSTLLGSISVVKMEPDSAPSKADNEPVPVIKVENESANEPIIIDPDLEVKPENTSK